MAEPEAFEDEDGTEATVAFPLPFAADAEHAADEHAADEDESPDAHEER